ncbi:SDR family NAD(P)-dependent oxidoreductase [Paenibacillus sp. FSL P4-0081]|uniref:SDR family NAD(P)-dependent oxidoreductase n=1 Tax=Paenibacillus sp. FSL P4-0081 TaxID=1536769 RepID=UPI000693BBF4|nr:SDR family NAD(P)-dependent oxidoreductase [Paenibacillus sp. FSL P4-0081]
MISGNRPDSLEERLDVVRESLVLVFGQVLGLDREELLEAESLKELGISSVNLVELLEAINVRFDLSLPTSILVECHHFEALAVYVAGQLHASGALPSAGPVTKVPSEYAAKITGPAVDFVPVPGPAGMPAGAPSREEKVQQSQQQGSVSRPPEADPAGSVSGRIAVIGLSCRTAGAANQDEFWEIVSQGKDCTRMMDNPEWIAYIQAHSSSPVPLRYGAMDGIEHFDPLFFNISPKEAEAMDAAQRIVLQECYRALEDAGYARQGGQVGTFIGSMGYPSAQDYSHHTMLGTDTSIMAARIAYCLDLKGPALAVNTACSSSLVAIDLACEKLRNGAIDLAIAGGITIYTHPGAFLFMNNAGMLSPTGMCRPFDNDADGIVVGDGAGIVILKRLEDALRDNDSIYGIIRGSGTNQDGQTSGITAPSFLSQSKLQQSVYERYGINVEDIQYTEAHGTATKLGDPVEIHALSHAFGKFTSNKQYCAIGSLKGNIGHTTAAAGVLSLIKVLLSFKHMQMPPSIHFRKENEHIDFAGSPFYVNTCLQEWPLNAKSSRLAAVSSFGFSGTNAHLVVEAHEAAVPLAYDRPAAVEQGLFMLSAASEASLREYARSVHAYLRSHPDVDTGSFLYTYQAARTPMEYRLAAVTGSVAQLTQQLEELAGEQRLAPAPALGRYAGAAGKKEGTDLADTAEGRQFLQQLLTGGKYKKLAELWVGGTDVGQAVLQYRQTDAKRLAGLPTHPFARERFAIPDIKPVLSTSLADRLGPAAPGHPLLQHNTSDLAGQKFTSVFTGDEFFFRDHVVSGQRLLPGSAYLEMARAALEKSADAAAQQSLRAGTAGIRLQHVSWSRPLAAGEEPVHVHITLYPEEDGSVSFEITGSSVESGDIAAVHSQGRLMLEASSEARSVIDLHAIRSQCGTARITASESYDRFEAMGIRYGPAHRGLEEMYIGKGQVLARLKLPEMVWGTGDAFVLHPGMLDSALQASLGLLIGEESRAPLRPLLPFAVENVEVISPCLSSMWVYIRSGEGEVYGGVRKLDADLCDEQGAVCVKIRGFSVRALDHPAEEDSTETLLLEPVWEEQTAGQSDQGSRTAPFDLHLVMLCGQQELADSLDACWNGRPLSRRWRICNLVAAEEETCLRFSRYAALALNELQAVANDSSIGSALVQLIISGKGEERLLSGLAGMLQTAALEHPKLAVQLIEAEAGAGSSAPDFAIQLQNDGGSPQDTRIRYQNGIRYVLRWDELEASGGLAAEPWRENGVYLITGGTGGLGRLFAREAGRQAKQATLVLTGRSPLDADKEEQLRQLRATGVRAEYRQADMNDRQAMFGLIRDIGERFGKLHGIIHSAGIVRDSLIVNKGIQELADVLAPKVTGLAYLDEATRHLELDFFVLFSSTAGSMGNAGQADYAAANAYMDAFAAYRSELAAAGQRQGRTLSINWPLWKDGGMSVSESTVKRLQDTFGFVPLQTDSGFSAFYRAFASERSQVMVVQGKPAQLRSALHKLAASSKVGAIPSPAPAPVKRNTDGDTKQKILAAAVRAVSGLLTVPGSEIHIDTDWDEFGFDAHQMQTAAVSIGEAVGFKVTPVELLEYPTIRQLAEHLAERMPTPREAEPLEAPEVHAEGVSSAPADLPAAFREQAVQYFKKLLSSAIKLPSHRIDEHVPLEKYGIDSIMVMDLTGELEKVFGPLSKTLFFEYQNLAALTDYFLGAHQAKLKELLGSGRPPADDNRAAAKTAPPVTGLIRPSTGRQPRSQVSPALAAAGSPSPSLRQHGQGGPIDIAVIGIAGRYPGAPDVAEYWRNLQQGRDCITEIPPERWDHSLYFDEDKNKLGTTYSKWGGFLDGMDQFDPLFFQISPLEAEVMDPQERLFLQCVYHTLEDAGYTRESVAFNRKLNRRIPVGIYAGVMYEEYQLYGAQEQLSGRRIAYAGSPSSIANRVSYWYNFQGPSIAVDTMCSSSLTAIHLACQSIQQGECGVAVAGGVNLSLHPNKYLMLAQGKFVSSKGRCESFGEGGDGYVPGEGVGAVLLKPLSEAVADGDRIYGVIKASAINHGGKTNGYSVPNPNAQAEVIKQALSRAGFDPRTVSYIEAHGTGTSLGDPIEIAGLSGAFSAYTDDKAFCAIGSAKSNIGHCESAAGIAGLTKVLLQLKHGQLAPSLHASVLNPNIDFSSTPFVVQRELAEWKRPVLRESGSVREYPRRAGISSFGAGGSNAHLLVEEYIPAAEAGAGPAAAYPLPAVIVLSAKNEERLRALAQALLDAVREEAFTDADLASIAHTLQTGREVMEERLALLADSIGEVESKLAAYLRGDRTTGDLFYGRGRINDGAAAVLTADEDLQHTVDAWLAKRKYTKLLDWWVQGLSVDWSSMYQGRKPRRIALPLYPFAKNRYWSPKPGADAGGGHTGSAGEGSGSAAPAGELLHPLLYANTSDFSEQRYSSAFTGTEFFFADHVVRGQKVLPGAAQLEMAIYAAAQASGRSEGIPVGLRLKEVVWVRPCTISEGTSNVHIGLRPQESGDIAFEIYGGNAGASGDNIYSQGRAEWSGSEIAPALELASLRAKCGIRVLTADDCYSAFQRMGIEYGAAHRAVDCVYAGDGRALAKLVLPASAIPSADRFILHPSLTDAAFQAAIGLMDGIGQEDAGLKPMLPFTLEELTVYGRYSSVVWAYVRWSGGDTASGKVRKMDIDLCNEQGGVIASLKGYSVRGMDGDAVPAVRTEPSIMATAAADRQTPSALMTLHPVWDTVPVERVQEWPKPDSRITIVGDAGPKNSSALEQLLPHAQSLRFQPEDTIEEIARRLADGGMPEHIVWIAPDAAEGSLPGVSLTRAQQAGVFQLFKLIKAVLLAGGGGSKTGWTVITGHTQSVGRRDDVDAAHAGVHGLIGSLAKEYPNWSVRLIDLESGGQWPLQELLSLPADRQGNAWAYRSGEWFRQKLIPVNRSNNNTPERILYRKGGVYVVIGGAGGIGEVWSEYMIRTWQAHIVWIGRREKDELIQAKLDRLGAFGEAPVYISGDASDRSSLQLAYDAAKKRFGRIDGVVHSAIVLADQSLANMDEARFRSALVAKVDTSVNMAELLAGETPDFVLFFSSMNAFMKSAGQSNYAAGCTFMDAYAHQLAARSPYPVKTMNWGYWGGVGVVASDAYQERMAQMGIGSIEPEEAMEALGGLLSGPLNQLALLKTTGGLTIEGISQDEQLFLHPDNSVQSAEQLASVLPDPAAAAAGLTGEGYAALQDMESQLCRMLEGQLLASGMFSRAADNTGYVQGNGVHGRYSRWLDASIALLRERKGVQQDSAGKGLYPANARMEALWSDWDRKKKEWLAFGGMAAQIALAETALRALPDILSGKLPATDVMFPNSSMELVEGVYKHNPVADAFNEVLGDVVAAYVKQRIQLDPSARIRILEIGAGTGGTSAGVLRKLKAYADNIQEYRYTDISQAFLIHAKETYGPDHSFLTYQLFNVESPLSGQQILPAEYDIAIAANVLHATKNIRHTLRNAKAVLKKNGLLLLNELHGQSMFTHLTFGLLDGWWRYEDARLRMPGSPGLSPGTWLNVLEDEGFRSVHFPAETVHSWGQQIIMAESDGVVRQQVKPVQEKSEAANKEDRVSVLPVQPVKAGAEERYAGTLREKTIAYLRRRIAEVLKMPTGQLDPRERFENYGIDSILVVQLTNALSEEFGSVNSTVFFEYQTVEELAGYFLTAHQETLAVLLGPDESGTGGARPNDGGIQGPQPEPALAGAAGNPRPGSRFASIPQNTARTSAAVTASADIAIVGLSGRYPGAGNIREFWAQLKAGRHGITEISKDRWDWADYYEAQRGKRGTMYSKWGGFIEGYDWFDPLFFGISPKEAKQMDPQERLFLETAYSSIEDAGYTPATLCASGKVGVYVGAMNGNYPTGASYWSIANRISYLFNFRGPSMAVDTACSSSLTAIHLAIDSLNNGTSECAIAGGVNLIQSPNHYLRLSAMNMLSSGDQCRSFGAGADGFVDGEGVGAIVLKPLDKAVRDGDHIYGVIKGSMLNAGGRTNGYTVPNPLAQYEVVTDALKRANVHARTISCIEAHGTGTALGDPIEITGLTRAFERDTQDKQFCSLGSVKSNIGHSESAAGIAGLTKVLLMLRHRQLVPSLHATTLNPGIEFGNTPFIVQQELADWNRPVLTIDGTRREYPRRAGISSFGAGGANAHLVVEEYMPNPYTVPQQRTDASRPCLIVLSARSGDQLKLIAQQLASAIQEGRYEESDLSRIAYTLQTGREAMEERAACVAGTLEELGAVLQLLGDGVSEVPGLYRGRVKENKDTIAALSSDDEMQEVLSKWMRQRKFDKLLSLWTRGLQLDWSQLYDGPHPQRISLPTYPFARERYWFTEGGGGSSQGQPLAEKPQAEQPPAEPLAIPVPHKDEPAAAGLMTAGTGTPGMLASTAASGLSSDVFDSSFYGKLLDRIMDDSISIDRAADEIQSNIRDVIRQRRTYG